MFVRGSLLHQYTNQQSRNSGNEESICKVEYKYKEENILYFLGIKQCSIKRNRNEEIILI